MLLKDKVSIVTGAGQGIGKAISKNFAKEGANVIVGDIDKKRVELVAEEINRLGGKAYPAYIDVCDEQSIENLVRDIVNKYGQIDLLVNNVGITAVASAESLAEEAWDKVMDINVKGVFRCSKAVGKQMMKNNGGTIINMASVMGTIALPIRIAYCVSKAAVIMLTKTEAVEWAKYNIRVNAIAPSYVMTETVAGLAKRNAIDLEGIQKRAPFKRMARPDEIANVATFLASENSGYITGQIVKVDGGWSSYGAW
jgi:NAD(P)-dependent dehydrogenase (short-subunit alcohol dehydrogenase family)